MAQHLLNSLKGPVTLHQPYHLPFWTCSYVLVGITGLLMSYASIASCCSDIPISQRNTCANPNTSANAKVNSPSTSACPFRKQVGELSSRRLVSAPHRAAMKRLKAQLSSRTVLIQPKDRHTDNRLAFVVIIDGGFPFPN